MVFAATRSRKAATDARQLAMYLANCAGGMPIERVALAFGRDASTVSHNIALLEDRRDVPAFEDLLTKLELAFAGSLPGISVQPHEQAHQVVKADKVRRS